jgi:hypothetical protein
VWWLAEREVSSAKTEVRKNQVISINQLNYKTPEISRATDELAGYIVCATKLSSIKFVLQKHDLLLYYKFRVLRAVTPVTAVPAARAVPPVRAVPTVRAVPPVRAVSPVRAVPPVREVPAARAVPPVREVPAARAVSPVREVPAARAVSPVFPANNTKFSNCF